MTKNCPSNFLGYTERSDWGHRSPEQPVSGTLVSAHSNSQWSLTVWRRRRISREFGPAPHLFEGHIWDTGVMSGYQFVRGQFSPNSY